MQLRDFIYCRTISQDDLNLFDIPEPPSSVRSDKQEERKSPTKCKCKCAVHQNNRESMDHEKSVSSSRLEGQQNQQTELSIVGEKIGVPKGLGAIAETLTSPDGKAYVNDLKNTIQKLENVSTSCSAVNRSSHCISICTGSA